MKRVVYVVVIVLILLLIAYYIKDYIKRDNVVYSCESIQRLKKQALKNDKKIKVYKESPIDSEVAAKVKALPKFGKDETWTICLYMVGSDLEDQGNNYLS